MSVALALSIKGNGTNTPPGSPAVGDQYIVGGSPTGAWAGHGGELATWIFGAWRFASVPKLKASVIWDEAASIPYEHDGSAQVRVAKYTDAPGSILTTRGDIIIENSTPAPARLAIGTNGQVLGTNGTDPAWRDPPIWVVLKHQTNAAVAAGAQSYGNEGSSALTCRFEVPAGKTLYVVLCAFGWDTGAGAGTWTLNGILRKNGATNVTLATVTTSSASSTGSKSTCVAIASALTTAAAGDLLQVGFDNGGGSPGPMGTNNKQITVGGWLL